MKKREMVGGPSGLTWEAIAAHIRDGEPDGFSNHELAAALGAPYDRVQMLTKLMYEAGALSRVQTGKSAAGTMLYYLPV